MICYTIWCNIFLFQIGGERMNYEVNLDTLYVFPIDKDSCKVVEVEDEYHIDTKAYQVMEHSCMYFGSSLNGRLLGSKDMLGSIYKAPIVVEESQNIIFFPTTSPNSSQNVWISLNNILNYEKLNKKTRIIFKNNKEIIVDIPYYSVRNQILRATMLESIVRRRKNGKKSD